MTDTITIKGDEKILRDQNGFHIKVTSSSHSVNIVDENGKVLYEKRK